MKMIDLKGRSFGRLTVIKRGDDWISRSGKTKNIAWVCKCSCGKEKVIRAAKLIDGSTRSCGCLVIDINSKPRTIQGHAGFINLFNSYRWSAIRRKLSFELTKCDAFELFQGNCYYCGIQPYQKYIPRERNEEATQHGIFTYNGIDRKNNNEGYTKDNSISCCGICNQAKMDLGHDEFLEKIKLIYENHFINASLFKVV